MVFGATLAIAVRSAVNSWPSIAMQLKTTEPMAAQLTMRILGGLAAALLGALLAGLCAGVGAFGARMNPPLVRIGRWAAVVAAVAAGAFVVGLQVALGLATPDAPLAWPRGTRWHGRSPEACSPAWIHRLREPELFVVYVVARLTRGFSHRLWLAIVVVVALECAASLVQAQQSGRSTRIGRSRAPRRVGAAAVASLRSAARGSPRPSC
jgi:hypothetical protein